MKKRSVKKIELNIPNRTFYFLLTFTIVILAGVGVYAFGGTSPSIMGHTLNELKPVCVGISTSDGIDNSWGCIDTPVSCTGANNALQYNTILNNWGCVAIDVTPDCPVLSCTWTGWQSFCVGDQYYGDAPCPVGEVAAGNMYEQFIQECLGGVITDSNTVCCIYL